MPKAFSSMGADELVLNARCRRENDQISALRTIFKNSRSAVVHCAYYSKDLPRLSSTTTPTTTS